MLFVPVLGGVHMTRLTPAELASLRERHDTADVEYCRVHARNAHDDRALLMGHIDALEAERVADMAAAMALVEALPRCAQCGSPATKFSGERPSVYCDEHHPRLDGDSYRDYPARWHDGPSSAPLRALVERLKPGEHPIWETLRNAPRRPATPEEERSIAAMMADPDSLRVVTLKEREAAAVLASPMVVERLKEGA